MQCGEPTVQVVDDRVASGASHLLQAGQLVAADGSGIAFWQVSRWWSSRDAGALLTGLKRGTTARQTAKPQ